MGVWVWEWTKNWWMTWMQFDVWIQPWDTCCCQYNASKKGEIRRKDPSLCWVLPEVLCFFRFVEMTLIWRMILVSARNACALEPSGNVGNNLPSQHPLRVFTVATVRKVPKAVCKNHTFHTRFASRENWCEKGVVLQCIAIAFLLAF